MLLLKAGAEINNAFVVAMGVGTVFVGLICIVVLCKVISLFCRSGKKEEAAQAPVKAAAATAPAESGLAPEKRREIIAAVSAALAEEMGTDISAIRIHSFKKL